MNKDEGAHVSSDVSRWKREMTSREIFVAEALIGTQLSHFGYERRYRSKLWSPLLAATRIYCRKILPVIGLQRRIFGFVGRGLQRRVKAMRRWNSRCKEK